MTLERGLKIGWGLGSLGTVSVLYIHSLLLLYFFTTVAGIGPALAGSMLFAAKLFDAVLAPAIGAWSDRARHPTGRRRPFLLAGALTCALAVGVIFSTAPHAGWLTLTWAAFGLILLALGYSLFNVPYLAMPAEMTASPQERSSLMSWRVTFVAVAGLVVTALAPALIGALGGGSRAYAWTGVILALLVATAMLIAWRATRRAIFTTSTNATLSALERWRTAWENRPFVLLLAAKILQLFGLAAGSAALFFFVETVLEQPKSVVAVIGLGLSLGTVASMPLWLRIGARLGKRNTYIVSCVAYSVFTLSWLLASPAEPVALTGLRALLIGAFSGGLLLMGQSILPDTIAYDYQRTGLRREGLYSGIYSFIEKTSSAFGPFVVGAVLQLAGYAALRPAGGQTALAHEAIVLGFVIIPAAAYLLSVIPLLFYKLDLDKPEAP